MDIQNLTHMANRIGEFFESFSDRDEALDGIGNHIRKFWEPRMRRALLTHLETQGPDGLLPIVVDALERHRAELV